MHLMHPHKLPRPRSSHPTYAILAVVFALLAYALLPPNALSMRPGGAAPWQSTSP